LTPRPFGKNHISTSSKGTAVNDHIATLRADIDPIARAGLDKASELGKTAMSAAKQKASPPKRRRKWWLPLLVLAVAGVVFAVKRNRAATDDDAYTVTGVRMSVADSTPEPTAAEAH